MIITITATSMDDDGADVICEFDTEIKEFTEKRKTELVNSLKYAHQRLGGKPYKPTILKGPAQLNVAESKAGRKQKPEPESKPAKKKVLKKKAKKAAPKPKPKSITISKPMETLINVKPVEIKENDAPISGPPEELV